MSRPARSRRRARRSAPRAQRGLVLVTGLLFLVVVTLLAMTLFRSSGLLERISAGTRDKQRSFEVAQATLQYAEWWIGKGNAGVGTACSGLVAGNTTTNVHVCTNALADPTSTPWSNGFTYSPPNVSVNTAGGQTGTGDVNYQALPGFYIEYAGIAPDGKTRLFRVTAYGYGGMVGQSTTSPETVTVVRSTYQVTPQVIKLDD